MPEYDVRQYRPGDRAAFLSLYREVFGEAKSEEWFAWKFEENPYVDHVPVLVATDGGDLVGARSFFALPVDGDGPEVALQPCDTMVHPEHRRRGLFTRMTERAIERYRGAHPFFFNFPNRLTLQGNLDLGWRVVSERASYYRIEDPGSVAAARTNRTLVRLAADLAAPLLRVYYRLRARSAPAAADVPVEVHDRPPAGELAALYRRSVPESIHAVRDERFYGWRFGNPDWEYTAYVAGGDDPSAAVVVGTATDGPPARTRLTDVVPLEAAPEPALAALLERVLAAHADTDLFVAPGQGVPAPLLRSFGFHADRSPALSLLANPTTHVVRSLTGEWDHGGRRLVDPDEWLLTFAEEDSS